MIFVHAGSYNRYFREKFTHHHYWITKLTKFFESTKLPSRCPSSLVDFVVVFSTKVPSFLSQAAILMKVLHLNAPSAAKCSALHVPWSKVAILGMVIQPLIGNPYSGYINPYYWVDDHPLLYGNNGSLDPSTHESPGKRGEKNTSSS